MAAAAGLPTLLAALRAQRHVLRRLDLVEQAERFLRAGMNDVLLGHLAAALSKLDVAAADAAVARAEGDLAGVIGAHLRLSQAQDCADGAFLHHVHETEDAQQAEATYWAARYYTGQRIRVITVAIKLHQLRRRWR